jgi:hypothetical protein
MFKVTPKGKDIFGEVVDGFCDLVVRCSSRFLLHGLPFLYYSIHKAFDHDYDLSIAGTTCQVFMNSTNTDLSSISRFRFLIVFVGVSLGWPCLRAHPSKERLVLKSWSLPVGPCQRHCEGRPQDRSCLAADSSDYIEASADLQVEGLRYIITII